MAPSAQIRGECGQTLILIVFSFTLLLGKVGLAIVIGLTRHEMRKMQNTANATALGWPERIGYPAGAAKTVAVITHYEDAARRIEVIIGNPQGTPLFSVLGDGPSDEKAPNGCLR